MNLLGFLSVALSMAFGGLTGLTDLRLMIQADTKNAESAPKTADYPTGFKLIRMTNGVKDDGAPFSSNTYETQTDKQKVWQDFFHYDSPDDDALEFEKQSHLARSSKH
jgi:hypothetical protein